MKRLDIHIGDTHGMLTVISDSYITVNPSGRKQHVVDCKCDCGNVATVIVSNMIDGRVKSCGCLSARINVCRGDKYGRLTVEEEVSLKIGESRKFKCLCQCGKHTVVSMRNLRSGRVSSCGCLRSERTAAALTKHGLRKHPLYMKWAEMKARCYNPNSNRYYSHGARGIKVCDEWRENFKAFYDWSMSNGYEKRLSIDRINNDGCYSPDNCRYADNYVQANNKRNNKIVVIGGVSKTIAQWCRHYNLKYHVVDNRMRLYKWDAEKAITTPVLK